MSASIDPVASAPLVEALSDESRHRSEPRKEAIDPPGSDTEEVPTPAPEDAAGSAARHLATEPLIPLDHEAHAGRLHAQQLVAKYANEQASEDADARELVTHHGNDRTAERRFIAERANADVADRRLAAERANVETLAIIALIESAAADPAGHVAAADGAVEPQLAAESADDDAASRQVAAERAQHGATTGDAAIERAKDDAAADKAAAARTEAASGEGLNVTA